MANLINGDRWVFDGVTTVGQEKELNGFHQITGILWTSSEASGKDIAADDDMYITDGADLRIAEKRAESAGDDFGPPMPCGGLPVQGFKVKVLDGGILTIWRKLPHV